MKAPGCPDVAHRVSAPVCAITGSGGYVGHHLTQFLRARGWSVREFSRAPRTPDGVAFRLGDPLVAGALDEVRMLVHCAYDFTQRGWDQIYRVNVRGTQQLLDAAVVAKVPRIVCLSSISAFDGARSLYGRAKLAIEQAAIERGAWVLRPGLVYGGVNGGMFGKLLERVRSLRIIPLIGSGSQPQYLVHADDLARPIAEYGSGSLAPASRVVTLAHPSAWEIRLLLRALASTLNKDVALIPIPWQFSWAALRMAEGIGISMPFTSDSIVSFVNQNPSPDFGSASRAGIVCREFRPSLAVTATS